MSESDYLAYQRADGRGQRWARRATIHCRSMLHLTDETAGRMKGQLDFVDNQVDRSSGTIRARAVFANPDDLFTRRAVRAHPHPGLASPTRRS